MLTVHDFFSLYDTNLYVTSKLIRFLPPFKLKSFVTYRRYRPIARKVENKDAYSHVKEEGAAFKMILGSVPTLELCIIGKVCVLLLSRLDDLSV